MSNLQTLVRKGFKVRLFQAHAALEGLEGGRVSREEIGKRVGKVLGTRAINQSTVASWFTDILPPADIGVGLAAVYDVPAGWLYFNERGTDGKDDDASPRVFIRPVTVPLLPPKELEETRRKKRGA